METLTSVENYQDQYLDVFGQAPGLHQLYTQICFCYPMIDHSISDSILKTLNQGLERLSASFPWVAGEVVVENSDGSDSPVFKIKRRDSIPEICTKDLSHDPSMPTMDDLRRSNFPSKILHESLICPCKTFSAGSQESSVFIIQANIIRGGLLLTFNAQHNTMDMVGQGVIIRLFSKACRKEPFTKEDLLSGNLPRRDLISYLDDSYRPGPELANQIKKPPPQDMSLAPPDPPPHSSWAYFSFSPDSLAALKLIASKTVSSLQGFVSTDDALTAYIWQSVLRARLPRLSPATQTTLARAVNVRSYLSIPAGYPGTVQNMTYNTYTIQELIDEPLGNIASQLRTALDPDTSKMAYRTRALATMMHRSADKGSISITATIDSSVDIMLSSWVQVNCYDLDFDLGLGKPEAVRRPEFDQLEGLFYLMSRRLDGEIAALLSLRDDDMERLKADQEFAQYAVYIG